MITDLDPTIRAALDRHVPAQSAETADWTDVARRATALGRDGHRGLRSRLRDRRAWFGIGAVAVALGCAGAIEHHRVYQLFGAGEPASGKAVERQLLSRYRWPKGLHVIASRSQLVFQLRQPRAFDASGPIGSKTGYALVAPLSNGAVCLGADMGQIAGTQCSGTSTASIFQFFLPPQAWRDRDGRLHLVPFVFWGIAPGRTSSMLLRGHDERLPVPLSPIRLPGRVVFAVRIAPRLEAPGHRPTDLIARDASGKVIARLRNISGNFAPTVEDAPVKSETVAGSGRESGVLITLRVGGVAHRFQLDHTCLTETWTTRRGIPTAGAYCGLAGGLVPFINPIADRAAIAWGRLPRGATTITVRYPHHSEQAVVYDRSYLFAITTAQLQGADLPVAIVAHDASGAVMARRSLARSLFPGY